MQILSVKIVALLIDWLIEFEKSLTGSFFMAKPQTLTNIQTKTQTAFLITQNNKFFIKLSSTK